jgi:hypothetical protein
MKVSFGRQAVLYPDMDESFDVVTARYRTAAVQYQDLMDKNANVGLRGEKLSDQERLDEEAAFDELDRARQALFDAAQQAYPTIH